MNKILKHLTKGDESHIESIIAKRIDEKTKTAVVTMNSEHLQSNLADLFPFYCDENTVLVADGIAVKVIANLKNKNNIKKITGVSLVEFLLKHANEKHLSMGVFGASKESLDMFEQFVHNTFPNIKELVCTNGYVENPNEVMQSYAEMNLDILLVAFGVPRQEVLIHDNIDAFKHGLLIGVGGSIDVIGGFKRRAPQFFIKTNTEWLYRIVREPKRIMRFIKTNTYFIFQSLRNK